jgi:hypothetical protein
MSYDPRVQAQQMRSEWLEMLGTFGKFKWPDGSDEMRDSLRESVESLAVMFVTAEALADLLSDEERAEMQMDLYEAMEAMRDLRGDAEMLIERIAAFRRDV